MLHLLSFTLASIVLLLAGSAAAGAQSSRPALDCGTRPHRTYAVVLDVSLSVRRNEQIRVQTEARYADLIGLIGEVLCEHDKVIIHTLPEAERVEMNPAGVLHWSETQSAERLAHVVSASYDRQIRHSDLLVTLRRIRRDLRDVSGIILVTDGSFYPHDARAGTWSVPRLENRIRELASEAARDTAEHLVIVGVRSDQELAIDSMLEVSWPPERHQRRIEVNGQILDLKEAVGSDLLRAIWGERFYTSENFSMWQTFVPRLASPASTLPGWRPPLHRLAGVSLDYLIFHSLPDGSCTDGQEPRSGLRRVRALRVDLAGNHVCVLNSPRPEELEATHASGVSSYVLSQSPYFGFSLPRTPMRGLQHLVVEPPGATCDSDLLFDHFARSLRWPPRDLSAAADLTILSIPSGEVVGGKRLMLKHPTKECLLASFSDSDWQLESGDYAFVATHDGGGSVLVASVQRPRVRVREIDFRPAGFPFPNDKLAYMSVCVEVDSLRANQRVHMVLREKSTELRPQEGKHCRGLVPSTPEGQLFGIARILSLDGTDVESGSFTIARDGDGTQGPEWIPFMVRPDGKFLLSWARLRDWALVGMAIQAILVLILHFRHPAPWAFQRWVSAVLGMILSAMILVAAAEAWVLIRHLNTSPIVAAILIQALVLVASALVPEYVEEAALS